MMYVKNLSKPERNEIIRVIEAFDSEEREVALLTLLRLNCEKEFCNLNLVTPKVLDEYTIKE